MAKSCRSSENFKQECRSGSATYLSEPLSIRRQISVDDTSNRPLEDFPRRTAANSGSTLARTYDQDGHGSQTRGPDKPTNAMARHLKEAQAQSIKLKAPGTGSYGRHPLQDRVWSQLHAEKLDGVAYGQQAEEKLRELDEKRRRVLESIDEQQLKRKAAKELHRGQDAKRRYLSGNLYPDYVRNRPDERKRQPTVVRTQGDKGLNQQSEHKPLQQMRTLREVEDVLASLNQKSRMEAAKSTPDDGELRRLNLEKDMARQRRQEIDAERLCARATQFQQSTQIHLRGPELPVVRQTFLKGQYTPASSSPAQIHKPTQSVVPFDRSTVATSSVPNPMEAMVGIVTQFNKLTASLGELEADLKPGIKRKGALEDFGSVLLTSAENLLAKTKEIVGVSAEHGRLGSGDEDSAELTEAVSEQERTTQSSRTAEAIEKLIEREKAELLTLQVQRRRRTAAEMNDGT